MSRNEFLIILRESLELSLEKDQINEQLDYYDNYISGEISKGRTEKEVLDELGDPRLIAKTIKTVNNANDVIVDDESGNSSNGDSQGRNKSYNGGYTTNRNTRNPYIYVGQTGTIGCVIFLLVLFIIFGLIIKFITGIAFTALGFYGLGPSLMLIILIVILWSMFGNRR